MAQENSTSTMHSAGHTQYAPLESNSNTVVHCDNDSDVKQPRIVKVLSHSSTSSIDSTDDVGKAINVAHNEEGVPDPSAADAYAEYIQLLTQATQQPRMSIAVDKLSYCIETDDRADANAKKEIPNWPKAFLQFLLSPYTALKSMQHRDKTKSTIVVLDNVSGVIQPGTMTLIIAPPGHGRSTYLRALAGHMALHNDKKFDEQSIRYNGLSFHDAKKAGYQINRLTSYLPQVDAHFPTLTVKETLDFVVKNAVVDIDKIESCPDRLKELHPKRSDLVISMLGLDEAKDTLAGDSMIRGISGGQRRRLQIGESLITNARLLLLDEFSNGLDSAVALSINESLRKWTRSSGGSVVAGLLQPTPESYCQYDNVILLAYGRLVYHGPRSEVIPYLKSLGAVIPRSMDEADFLQEFLFMPQKFMPNAKMPIDSLWLQHAFQKSEYFERIQAEISTPTEQFVPFEQLNEYNRAQFHRETTYDGMTHAIYSLRRQFILTLRNKTMWMPRILQSLIVGVIVSTLFINLSPTQYTARVGVILFAITNVAFGNMPELPAGDVAKPILYRHLDGGFYKSFAYVFAALLVIIPVLLIETISIGSLIYWISNFADNAGRYVFFLFAIFLVDFLLNVVFRCLSALAPNQFVAQQTGGPVVGFLMLFGGFLITRLEIPIWLIWLYWMSPFSWIVKSVAISEFSDSRYDFLVANPDNPTQKIRAGTAYLLDWQMNTQRGYEWYGVIYTAAIAVIFVFLVSLVIAYKRSELTRGTKRLPEVVRAVESGQAAKSSPKSALVDVQISSATTSTAAVDVLPVPDDLVRAESVALTGSSLPFRPMVLAWKNIKYTVPIKKGHKTLLNQISGYAMPGQMLALMGSSGAGKTTLMDVISDRKTVGKIEGEIFVNGDPSMFGSGTYKRSLGYVEQFDQLMPFATVSETLHFSAKLRLPRSVTSSQRNDFVEHLIDILELKSLANRLIGNESLPVLSPAQKKLVSIGVEMCANTSILFCDEPTTGLDARSAVVVMRVIKRIANTGRTVVCTIHQPSAEVFSYFDRLLLLRSGGRCVYFDNIGLRGQQLISYLERVDPNKSVMNEKLNPADWMLNVIGAETVSGSRQKIDFSILWEMSPESERATAEINQAISGEQFKDIASKFSDADFKPVSFRVQFVEVCIRQFRSYWRNNSYSYVRLFSALLLGTLYGLVFYHIAPSSSIAGVQSQLGGIFLSFVFAGILSSFNSLPVQSSEKAVYVRECSSNTYNGFAYGLSQLVVEVPYIALTTLMFCVPFFQLIGLNRIADVAQFFKYILAVWVGGFTLNSLGTLLISSLPNVLAATALMGLLFTLCFLFAGVFIPSPQIPTGWKWFYYINPISWGLKASVMPFFYCDTNVHPNSCLTMFYDGSTEYVSNYAAAYLGTTPDAYWVPLGYLFLIGTICRLLALIATQLAKSVKR